MTEPKHNKKLSSAWLQRRPGFNFIKNQSDEVPKSGYRVFAFYLCIASFITFNKLILIIFVGKLKAERRNDPYSDVVSLKKLYTVNAHPMTADKLLACG